jgi:hypothetical protein
MPIKTEKDLWVEMSIREISTQAHFAEIAYSHIDPKAANGSDAVFSSIHSFLSHCAMVSKMLSSKYDESTQQSIGDVLGISTSSSIHTTTFRNHLEHYDERLRRWIRQYGVNIMIGDHNIGPKSAFKIQNMVFVRHYDPTTSIFTFVNDDFDLGVLFGEVQSVKGIADKWIKSKI